MIQLTSLTKSFGDRVLLDDVTWQISDRERVGLCGPNGAGKTTLLRMLAGLDEPDRGAIIKPAALTVGYLPQDGLAHSGRSVFDEASLAFAPLLALKSEMHDIEERLSDPSVPEAEHEAMLARYSELQDRFRLNGGYSIELKTATVLNGLGFAESDFSKPTETFSGGWQMRLALAKLLLGEPNLLLLDEPTNHLDLDARNWLEEYLSAYVHAVILVSHDRFFLDTVVTRIADLNLRTLTDYHGNYSDYIVERDARMERLRQAKREQDEETARVKQFIDRFRYQATKAAQVQSRIKMLEKVVPIEAPPERKRIHFTFPTCVKSGRTVLELRNIRKAYGELVVLNRINLHFERGDRIALVGHNGAGKSTLMRLLSGVESPDSGERREGHQVVMQYFAQDEATRLDPTLTVYETLATGSPDNMVPAIRNILGGFLFSGDDVYKRASVLSGGERTRLAVARMLLRPSNTLLLDEPTNHLDLESKEVLLEALEDFGGTLVFVSHDRYFVEKLATKIVEVGHGDVVLFPGTYGEFLWRKAQRDLPAPAVNEVRTERGRASRSDHGGKVRAPSNTSQAAPPGTRDVGATNVEGDRTAQHDARKRQRNDDRRQKQAAEARRAQIADLESRIAEREQAIRDLEAAMAAPGFFDDREAAKPVIDRHQILMWEVGDLMHRWEELQMSATATAKG
jgi:ATP-binding cassette, subfamily F, member 3